MLALLLATMPAIGPGVAQPALTSWQSMIQAEDRPRLAGLWRAWTSSLADVIKAGGESALKDLGPVVVPPVEPLPGRRQAVSTDALPAAGDYRCRTIRMGQRDDGWPRDNVMPLQLGEWGPCTISGSLTLTMLAGPQRLSGKLWADGDRMVFLGALSLAAETGIRHYGDDPDRDHLGVLRAFAPGQWRLELPWPRWQSTLLLVEISAA